MPNRVITFEHFELRTDPLELRRDGVPQLIRDRSLRLLLVLVENSGVLVSQTELMRRLWPDVERTEGNLRVHVSALRRVLGLSSDGKPYIINQPGQGYRFIQDVRELKGEALPTKTSGLNPSDSPTALPAMLTRLIGRERALDGMATALKRTRLLSIVGPGGVGKTSVAIALASRVAGKFRDGVCFVDLSTLEDGAFVGSSISAAMRLPITSTSPETQLLTSIGNGDFLLLLDNCEHIVQRVADICGHLLESCPKLKILVTSREPLNLSSELQWRLEPLELLAIRDHRPSDDEILTNASVRLFIERASTGPAPLQRGDFNLDKVIDVCRSLDGLPLAIELAASYARTLGIEALSGGLDERLFTLQLGSRTNERHESLQALLDWGWVLLGADTALLLTRLAVFRGKFEFEGADALGKSAGLSSAGVRRCMSEAIDKSLLVKTNDADVTEYYLLETTRVYAMARLRTIGAESDARREHARYLIVRFQESQERAMPEYGTRQRPAREMNRINDVRSSLDWLVGAGSDLSLGADLTIASASLWLGSANLKEFAWRIEAVLRALLREGQSGGAQEMRLQMLRGALAFNVVGTGEQRTHALQRALEIARKSEDRAVEMTALWNMMGVLNTNGDYLEMNACIDQIIEIADADIEAEVMLIFRLRALADSRLGNLQKSLFFGQIAIQKARAQTVLGRARFHYDPRTVALANQSFALWIKGRLRESIECTRDALEVAADIRDPPSQCYVLTHVGVPLAIWSGDFKKAVARIDEVVTLAEEHGFLYHRAFAQAMRAALRMLLDASTLTREGASSAYKAQPQLNREILVTIASDLVDDRTVERARSGKTGWSTAEVLRASAARTLDASPGSGELRRSLLMSALSTAIRQKAVTWQIKVLTDLLMFDPEASLDGVSARQRLDGILKTMEDETEFPHIARALLVCGN